ncbi:MAG: ABC transporter ATP-binding protein [Planctomycetota bacterium]
MIEVEHLTKRFGSTIAVDDVSFRVEKGEVVGFLGPNGAGKTTTIRALTCFHPPSAGRCLVDGFDVSDNPLEVRRRIGYLPENVPLYTDLRVEEYLRYRAELKGVPKRERKDAVQYAMERCGVVEVRRKMVGHVSRGYRQRVGLADALVAKPPLLILDEPTSGLDPNQRRKMKELIRDLADEHTVLFSSHILAEVADVSDRILMIVNGRLRADGALEELLAQAPGRRVRVTARCESDDLVAIVAEQSGTQGARVDGVPEAGGYNSVTADLERDVDPRDALSARLSERGVPVRELRLDLPSLERFFTEVTLGREQALQQDQEGAA